jgi:hypothetical protein
VDRRVTHSVHAVSSDTIAAVVMLLMLVKLLLELSRDSCYCIITAAAVHSSVMLLLVRMIAVCGGVKLMKRSERCYFGMTTAVQAPAIQHNTAQSKATKRQHT